MTPMSTDSGRFNQFFELEKRIEALEKRATELEQDMWRGDNHNPGITTRMALVENVVEKISKNLQKIVWLLVATIVGIIVKIVLKG
jgi:hypothetical protein